MWAALTIPVLWLAAILAYAYEDGMNVFVLMGRFSQVIEYASFIKDDMITELMDYPRNMMLSIDIVPIGMDEAIKMVDKVIMSVDSDANRWQQRQNANNNFTANLPYQMEQMRKFYKSP